MTTYTLSNGTAVFRNPATDLVTSVDQADITLDLVVPDSETSMSYTVDPLGPGEGPGDETVSIDVNDYNVRLDGTLIGTSPALDPEVSIFEVKWTAGGVPKTSTVLVLFLENDPIGGGGVLDGDYIFVMDGDAIPSISTPAQWNAFEGTITSIAVPTGAFGPGVAIPLTSIGGTLSQDDRIDGGADNDIFRGGAGDDMIFGNDGNDRLLGGNGNDYLDGGNGRDRLDPGENSFYDTVSAGKGNDTIIMSSIKKGYVDIVHYDLTNRITVDIDAGANTGTITKKFGGVTTLIDVKNPIESGSGPIGGLGIYGTDKGDVFNLAFGTVSGWMQLRGRGGNDTFNIGSGDVAVRLDYRDSPGNVIVDLKLGTANNDGFGNKDTIIGTGDVWEVRSSMNNDIVRGSAADESFILMAGADIVNGRGGFDRLRYDRTGVDGVDVDLEAGTGTGVWRGEAFNHTISNIEWLLGSNGNDDLIGANDQENRIDGRDGDDIIDGANRKDILNGEGGNDDIAAGGGNDIVDGGAGNDKLLGEAGHDTIRGGAGNDIMNGAKGDDTMIGGKGRDKMNGGTGNDTMTGNSGKDVFIFSAGNDIVTDFKPIDRIDLRKVASITSFTDLKNNHTDDIGGNLVINDGAGNTMTLNGVTEASLLADDFIF